MPRWIKLSLGCCSALACFATPVVATAGGPTASAARACSAPDYPGSGYFTALTVKGASCGKGRRVTLAHYRCRTSSGKSGRCGRRVLGYRCSEGKRNSIPTEFNARVTCRRGAKRVVYVYQQNT